jgi:23S rRNA (guanine745-N1)-methyltransferase
MQISYENSGTLYYNGPKRHCYDFASGGYVNLTKPGQSGGGDSKQAVKARSSFLDLGYYAPLRDRLCDLMCDILKPSADTLIVDAGCGEGYYSCEIAQRGFAVAGFDLPKFATDAAAKRAKKANLENAFFGVASVFELPIADNSAKAVVNIFAPCVNDEYYRVIDKGGYLIVACAGPDHLLGLKRAIYKEIHLNDMRADMPISLKHLDSVRVKYDIELNTNESIKNLFAMTPYYWKTSPNDVKKLDYIDRLNTEIDVILEIYQKI